MTQFTKENLHSDGMYLTYGPERTFVARIKHGGTGSFKTFLIKNFTVEEYFNARQAGNQPLTILESKGYIMPHIKKWLKEANLPISREGVKLLISMQGAKNV